MSYLFFSQTSNANGTRDTWGGGLGGTGGVRTGRIDGVDQLVDQSAFDVPASNAVNGRTAVFDLEFLSGGDASFFNTAIADARVFDTAATPGLKYNPVFDALGVAAETITAKLADADWNAIKNIEILIDSSELAGGGFGGIDIENFVDVRIKLGTADVAAPPATDTAPGAASGIAYDIAIANAKRGQLDYSDSDGGVATTLSLASNNQTWQNSFFVDGSGFGDRLVLAPGDHTGRSTDNQVLVTDGSLTLLVADLGAGNDLFDGSGVRAATQLTLGRDGGSFVIGASLGVIGFSADAADSVATQLADWLDDATALGLDLELAASVRAGTASVLTSTVDNAGDAASYFRSAADGAAALAPLGIMQPPGVVGLGVGNGSVRTGSRNEQNFELNEYQFFDGRRVTTGHDELAVRWDASVDVTQARIEVSLLYSAERGSGEQAYVELWNNGALVSAAWHAVIEDTGTYAAGDPGRPGLGHFVVSDAAGFDEIRFIGRNTPAAAAAGDPTDYLVNGIELLLPGTGIVVQGGDRAVLGAGRDALFYDVGNQDGVDEILGFTRGGDTLTVALAGDVATITEVGADTIVTFVGYAGAIVLRGVTGAVVGTDIILA
jgi:hypothetical protein